MPDKMGSRRVTDWQPGDATHDSALGMALYLASQQQGSEWSYTTRAIRDKLWSSQHLRLDLSNQQHRDDVDDAVRRVTAWRTQLNRGMGSDGELRSMPDVRSFMRSYLPTQFAYTVTAQVESTSARNPGTMYRTIVVFSDERLTAEQLVQRARDIGADQTGRDRYWGRRGDWSDAIIRLNVAARRE